MKFAGLAAVCWALAAVAVGSRAEAKEAPSAAGLTQEAPGFPTDPAIRRGVLPNGLHYLIQRNASPQGAVSLRFAVDVGSYEETDAERGYAHFIEHMAFRSTRGFPDGSSDKVFAPWGVAFARDQNAATTAFATTYKLDMPKPDAAQLRRGMGWLRDAADGIVFTPDGVGRERGVVLAEKEARDGPLPAAQEAIGRFQAAELRSINRSPIGLKATLDAATPADLKRFYDRWYRPEHALVTVVGDLPVDDLEALVKTAFSDWRAQGPSPSRAPLVPPPLSRPAEAFTLSGPTLPTAMSACRLQPGQARGPLTLGRLRQQAQSQIWQAILNQRLTKRASEPNAHLLTAAMTSGDVRDASITCLIVMPTAESWAEALAAAQVDLNRFTKDGPTEIETETATEVIRSRLRGAILSAGSRASRDLADELQARSLNDLPLSSPADALYAYDQAVEDLTPDMIRTRFAADWSGPGPLLAMMAPSPPTREALLAAWTRGAGAAGEQAQADRATQTWAYQSFGKPGKVIERSSMAEAGFSRFKFANGVILNFKPTKLEPNKAAVWLSFGDGRRQIDDSQYTAVQLGGMVLTAGGLGRHSYEDIQAIFASSMSWEFQMGMGPHSFAIRSDAFADSLDSQLQVLAAYMTDPGFRPEIDARLPTSVELIYRAFVTRPDIALNAAILERVDPGSPGNLQPRETVMQLKSADLERVLKPILTTSPVEVTIVGDVDEAHAIGAVAATFGALPPRTAPANSRPEPRFQRYPETSPPLIRIEHQGAADKAVAMLVWPLYVSTPERRREEYSLKLLAAIFDTALRHRIRDELGKTYAPRIFTTGPDFGDQGALQVAIEAQPQDLPILIDEVRTLANQLRTGAITAQMLEDARQPILAAARARRETNGWWAATLNGSARFPALLEEGLQYEPLMSAATLADVRTAATTWLAREPIVGAAYPQAGATGARP